MGNAQALYALWLREFKVFLREKSRVVGALATPMIFLFAIGYGLEATTEFTDPRYAKLTYRQFVFPGIVGMSVLFGTIFYGMGIIWDRRLDVLKEVLVAPVSRTTIFFGKILGGCTESVIQAVILVAVGVPLFGLAWAGAPAALGYGLLMAIVFVSIGLFIGSFFTSYEGFNLVMGFLVFPAFALSGAIYPISDLPPVLTWLTRVNPATYAVDGIRGSLTGIFALDPLLDVAVLVAWALAFLLAGTWAFKRMT